jgi:hypothetical protein
VLIETRLIGKKPKSLDSWSIPTPPAEPTDGGESLTLRHLIARVVRNEVQAFEQRERSRRLMRVLTEREVEAAAARGKVDLGGRPRAEPVEEDLAIATALQGFEDGLYLVLLDGAEQRDLDRPVYLTDESRLTFVRLTFLAGA